jgi:hypothetical protein
MLAWLRSLADAILGKTGKPDRLDVATRMAIDADFSARETAPPTTNEPAREVDPIDELMRIVGGQGEEPPPRRPKVLPFQRRRRGH